MAQLIDVAGGQTPSGAGYKSEKISATEISDRV